MTMFTMASQSILQQSGKLALGAADWRMRAKTDMNAADFIAKWSDVTLRERQGSQEHFLDLSRLFGHRSFALARFEI